MPCRLNGRPKADAHTVRSQGAQKHLKENVMQQDNVSARGQSEVDNPELVGACDEKHTDTVRGQEIPCSFIGIQASICSLNPSTAWPGPD